MIKAEEVELQLIENTLAKISRRDTITTSKELNSYEIGECLYELKSGKVIERRLGISFPLWVRNNVRDRDGRPRSEAWANNLIHGFLRVESLPALKEFFHVGWTDDEGNKRRASWATVVAAADWVHLIGIEKKELKRLKKEALEALDGDTLPDEYLVSLADEANDIAGLEAVQVCKEKKSHHIRADIKDYMENKSVFDATIETRARYAFTCEADIVSSFVDKARVCASILGSTEPTNIPEAMVSIIQFMEVVGDARRVPDGPGASDAGLAHGARSGPGGNGDRQEEAPRE